MEYKDYYRILGVERNADLKSIKRAYRKLALEHHPDKNPGDKQAEETFKEINEAYEVLGDPNKRARYDQLGESYHSWQRRGGRPGGFDWSQWTGSPQGNVHVEFGDLGELFGGGFSEFFNTIFGGMGASSAGRAARGARGRDIEHSVRISLSEAYSGSSRVIQLNGRRLEVKIPKGAKTGTKVRIAGQGESHPGQPGDLYLVLKVDEDPRFERRGDDLYADLEIDLYRAVLGGEAQVHTPAGMVVLSIPAHTQPGKTFRLRGRGMPKLRSPNSQGDLYVRLSVKIPDQLSKQERELFEQLASLHKQKNKD